MIAADIQDDKGARIEEEHKGAVRYVRCDVSSEKDIEAAIALRRNFSAASTCCSTMPARAGRAIRPMR